MNGNDQLEKAYEAILRNASSLPKSDKLSPPLLLRKFEEWNQSNSKVMIFGQETLGWSFRKGEYYDWPFPDIRSFLDFSNCAEGVQAYSLAYEIFDFSKHQPENYRSPFWRMYRALTNRLENDVERSIVWNNIFKLAYDGGSHIGTDIAQGDMDFTLNLSKEFVHAELEYFKPKACIFFSGPNYDFALHRLFDDLEFQEVGERQEINFSKVKSRFLPENSFRTYHPGYLNRTKLFDEVLEKLTSKIAPNTLSKNQTK